DTFRSTDETNNSTRGRTRRDGSETLRTTETVMHAVQGQVDHVNGAHSAVREREDLWGPMRVLSMERSRRTSESRESRSPNAPTALASAERIGTSQDRPPLALDEDRVVGA